MKDLFEEKKEFLYIGIPLVVLLIITFCINLAPLFKGVPFKLGNRLQFLGLMFTLNVAFWGAYKLYNRIPAIGKKRFEFIENHPLALLLIFIVLALSWLCFVIFRNPYLYSYNHGDGAAFTQYLHNICRGVGPETSLYSNLEGGPANNPYFYVSLFATGLCLLPLFLLAPLYWLYPYPPMHVFAVVIIVIFFGSLGMYLAIRAMGGSKTLSLLGAIGYCILPMVEYPILYKGYFSNLGFAVYPYIFAFLFSRKWTFFYISSLLLSLIGLAYVYSVIALGVITAIFFRARRQAVVICLIGIVMMILNKVVFLQSIKGIWTGGMSSTDFFIKHTLNCDIGSLLLPLIFNSFYVLMLLMAVYFIPLFGIRRKKIWNWPIVGMLSFALIGCAMGIFRGHGWIFHRNNNIVVPIYLAAFMAYINIAKAGQNSKDRAGMDPRKSVFFGFLLFSGIVSASLWLTLYYPWRIEFKHRSAPAVYSLGSNHSSASVLRISPNKKKLEDLLRKINEFVPDDASIAFRVDAGLEAFLANRQKVWRLGSNPDGVEYYIVQTKAINEIADNYPSWQESVEKIEHNVNIRLLYKDEAIVIYKDTKPVKIPRLESVLGWKVLFKSPSPDK